MLNPSTLYASNPDPDPSLCFAVCGGPGVIVQVIDFGTGTDCDAILQNSTFPLGVQVSCRQPLFGVQCGSLNGSLTLFALNIQNSTANYRGPVWNNWLSLMGLAGINSLNGNLIVVADQLRFFPIPQVTPPDFLPRLVNVVGALTALENRNASQSPVLVTIPGFKSVTYAQSAIEINGTALQNFRGTLDGLVCPPFQFMSFTSNPRLRSFAGLENLGAPPFFPAVASITAGTALNQPVLANIDTLYNYAGCAQGGWNASDITSGGAVNIKLVTCPSAITSFKGICDYIATSSCTVS